MKSLICFFISIFCVTALAQNTPPTVAGVGLRSNLSPISASLGTTTILSTNTIHSELSNPATLGFAPNEFGVSVVYNPWILGVKGGDMMNISLGGFYKFGATHGAFLKASYFNIGDVELYSSTGTANGNGYNFEWNASLGYAYAISNSFSLAAAIRYMQSQLVSTSSQNTLSYSTAHIVSGDLYVLYSPPLDSGKIFKFDAGLVLSNLGTKAEYSDQKTPQFISSYAGIAASVTAFAGFSTLRLMGELKKDLVPYAPKSGTSTSDIETFYNQSIFDAWGSAFTQTTLGVNVGFEYGYNDFAFLRIGYFNDNFSYYTRDAYTFGLGYKFPFGLSVNASFWLPGNAYAASSRFSNTFIVGVNYEF